MRELERNTPTLNGSRPELPPIALVGPGRVGHSLHRAAQAAGLSSSLHGRDDLNSIDAGAAVLIAVPDRNITEAAEAVLDAIGSAPAALGHCSGAARLDVLPERVSGAALERLSIHPLQTIPGPETELAGVPAAVSGASPRALELASSLAGRLGLEPFRIDEDDRAAYHAAAAMASNFLMSLEAAAAELLAATGLEGGDHEARRLLAPLVRASAENWIDQGPSALTGPVARGDEGTIEAHREAIAELRPELSEFYDALVAQTRRTAAALEEAAPR